ncbi:hypothetical protein Tco_0572574 [Tanacetum coccineum]
MLTATLNPSLLSHLHGFVQDGKVKTVTEASVKRHLKLADADGISSLPTTEIFDKLSLMGAPSTSPPPLSPTTRRTIRHESVVPQPRSPTRTPIADEAASTGVDVRYGGATITVSGLEAGQGRQYDITRIDGFMYNIVKESENLGDRLEADQGRQEHYMEFEFNLDDAKDVSTADKDVSTASAAVTTASVAVTTASPTRVSIVDDITMAETLVYIRRSAVKGKGKGKIEEPETVQTKTKLQQRQERLGFEVALRLQVELDKEERQRIARVHEETSSFNVEEWEDIKARVEADEELAQRLQAEEREKYTEAE